jgi:hypothetical protein
VANVPPRGLFARYAGVWENPLAVYARVAGVWKPVEFVYAMRNGAWQLLWSRSATSPTTVTIAYTRGQVNVTWVPTSPSIVDTYNIYRPDGSGAGTVVAGTTSFVDVDPKPLSGAYTVKGVLGGVEAITGTASNSLDLRLQAATLAAVVETNGSVTLNWTPAAVGAPDSWNLYTFSTTGVYTLIANIDGLVNTYNDPSAPAGVIVDYRLRPVLSGIEGTERGVTSGTPPKVPTSVVLAAVGASNLRLTWVAATGTVTGYEVETSTDNTAWAASADDASPVDWATGTTTGYMRVRTLAPGGVSAWVTKGPVAAITDVTPPSNAAIQSWMPESSYGRMVVRFATQSGADVDAYLVQQRLTGGAWADVGTWVSCNPSTIYSKVCSTRSAGQSAEVKVILRDAAGNQNTGDTAVYVLDASPIVIDPSGSLSGTFRNGAWRNDSSRSTTELATGWTSSGHNMGCFFYGTTIYAAISDKTVLSATMEYYRENEGGLSSAVVPLFWTHQLATRSGTPVPDDEGASSTSRSGPGVVRSTPNDTATFALPAGFINALKTTAKRGLCMYRGYQGSGDPDNYYALMGIGDVANNGVVNGRLRFTHLG